MSFYLFDIAIGCVYPHWENSCSLFLNIRRFSDDENFVSTLRTRNISILSPDEPLFVAQRSVVIPVVNFDIMS